MSLVPVFYYDDEKFFTSAGWAQRVDDELLMPANATTIDPLVDDAHFAQWNGQAWTLVAKPTCIEDFVGVQVSHTSQTPRCIELRALIQKFADTSSEYRIIRGSEDEGLWWSAEKIPEPTMAERAQRVRSERDARLNETVWRLQRHEYQKSAGVETTLTDDEIQSILLYQQALRDVPQQAGFPDSVAWPTKPAAMNK